MKNKVLTFAIIFFIGLSVSAQEYLSGFSYLNKSMENHEMRRSLSKTSLPFFDDFSETNVYLDASKWQNRSVLVNSGFSLFPINYNVATLDALDATGKVYSHASSTPFVADSLMSLPISLVDENGENLSPADSLYLSFYYQPQGNGDAPENNDSLVLMFGYQGDTTMVWEHVWSTNGLSLDSFLLANDNRYFKQVMIPIKNENYFTNDLTILFYNYATLPFAMYPNDRSNVDTWNIDFIYLNKGRSYDDTSYPLVSMSEKSPSLLKRYQSMPYRQYKSNPTVAMSSAFPICMANLDADNQIAKYYCHIENLSNDWTYDYKKDDSYILSPYTSNGLYSDTINIRNFLLDMDNSIDTTSYLITHIINVETDSTEVKGDTLCAVQHLYNYYAYDDGTPERGYGVVPDDSYFASQFTISMSDTLCGVYLLFNRTYNDANYDFFDIVVWNDNNGRPGNEIYRLKNQRPEWDEEEIYKFAYYPFDKLLKVNGTIYVGLMQHSAESINIGFDTSIDNQQYNFYETGDGWKNSGMKGSLMIRPVLGGDYVIEEKPYEAKSLGLYPVPSKDVINIGELSAQSCEEVIIFDMTGRLMKHFSNDVNLDISDLSNGLYMIRVITEEGKSYTEKFVISK